MRYLLLAVIVLMPVSGAAQPPPGTLTEAINRSVRELAAERATRAEDPCVQRVDKADKAWRKVRQLRPGQRIRVVTRGNPMRELVFIDATAEHLTASRPPDQPQAVLQFDRAEIVEVRRRPAGSIAGAIGGAVAGGFLGFWSAANLAYKQCGGSCSDEKFLMGASLVGLPVAGALLGSWGLSQAQWKRLY